MKKIEFKLQVYCTVGWDDNEDTATLYIDSFEGLVEAIAVLQKVSKSGVRKLDESIKQTYQSIKESLVSNSGEQIMMVGEAMGVQCSYEDDRGIRAEMSLSDNFGIMGSARVDNEEHANEYKKLLAEAKKLATGIMKL